MKKQNKFMKVFDEVTDAICFILFAPISVPALMKENKFYRSRCMRSCNIALEQIAINMGLENENNKLKAEIEELKNKQATK